MIVYDNFVLKISNFFNIFLRNWFITAKHSDFRKKKESKNSQTKDEVIFIISI